MAEQYFEANPESGHDIKSISVAFLGREFTFKTDAGVFSKDGLDEGSELMLSTVLDDLSGRVLDLGCGWGPVGTIVSVLKPATEVTMTDINKRAVDLAQKNVTANQAKALVFNGDGFEKVSGLFDWILFNPPIRAGKQVIYKLFEDAKRYLKQEGRLVIVIRKQQGALSAKDFLGQIYDEVVLLSRKKGYHVFSCGGEKHAL